MTKQILNIIFLCALLTGCNTIQEVSIDNLVPGKFNFVKGMDSVAVVNNTTTNIAKNTTINDTTSHHLLWHNKSFLQGRPETTMESMASVIANQGYFKQVVVCDSALRRDDPSPDARALTQEEVQSLCNDLNSNTIISLENVWLNIDEKATLAQENNITYCYRMTDVKARPVIRIYVPSHNKPLATIVLEDSTYLQASALTPTELKKSIQPIDSIVVHGSEFAGKITEDLMPHWTTEKRIYYTNMVSSSAQEANYYISRGDWIKAERIWKSQIKSANTIGKARYAFNIALSYEMNNQLKNAIKWIKEAETIMQQKKNSKSAKIKELNNTIVAYKDILQQRLNEMSQLNLQMRMVNNKK